jgi:hypothetical protein
VILNAEFWSDIWQESSVNMQNNRRQWSGKSYANHYVSVLSHSCIEEGTYDGMSPLKFKADGN